MRGPGHWPSRRRRALFITSSTHVAFCSRAGTQGDLDPYHAQYSGKELGYLDEVDVSCATCATTSDFHSGIRLRTNGGTCEAVARRVRGQSIYVYWTSLSSPALRSLENVEREVMRGAARLRMHVALAATESVGVVQSQGRCLQGVPIRQLIDLWHTKH